MKHFYSLTVAAATVVASLIRLAISGESTVENEQDRASPVPRITSRAVEQMAYAGATDTDIADRFLIDEATLRRRYRDTLRVARAIRRMTIRSLQFDLAKKMNASILTWLGRNELGQALNPNVADEPMPEVWEAGSEI
jgi:hypothetical protein